jgi:tape measure domain-containing protein
VAKINLDIAVNQRDAQRKINRLSKSTDQARRGFDRLSLSVKQSSTAFGSFVGNVAAIGFTRLIGGLAGLGASSVRVTGELETLATQFEVLTGSVATANQAVQDLQQFAATTPFQFKDLARATQRLLSFGFTLEEAKDNLKDLGDVAAASGSDINELSLIFGQVRAAGKLTGERLLQLQERAIPIGPAIAKSLGVAESAVRELVSQGKVDFATFEEAFKSLNDAGEFAFEGTIKRARTLEGRISTLKDNFELLQANIGQKLGPAFKALLSTVTTFIQRIQQTRAFNSFLETLSSSIPSAIEFAINAFSFLVNTTLNLLKAFNLVRSGIATAISAIVQGIEKLFKAIGAVEKFLGLDSFAKTADELAQVKSLK